ncbi:hypothetical protein FAZ69_27945 [Trinickia terrae]|uniref:Uncharacterized protein n=1 Tax=Trinickia terrae TaxID=2571161 RepID=A0A4U1HN18_9BURK|nr:hypothetical protein [Trinickia terrae]TKC81458.1 hypothetical protein FAZ69_27945 [Trinickia terrae]
MQPDKALLMPSTERVIAGYFASVTVATLTFVAIETMSRVTTFESSTNFTFWQKAADLVFMSGLTFFASWAIAVLTCAIPCAILSFFVRFIKINIFIFYVAIGVGIGLLTAVIYIVWLNPWGDGESPLVPFLGISGGIAGFTFWGIAGRHYR